MGASATQRFERVIRALGHLSLVALGCSPARDTTRAVSSAPALLQPRASAPAPAPSASPPAGSALPPAAAQLEPDGSDDEPPANVTLPAKGHFEQVGRHWAALTRVCDFAVHDGALYLAHATRPLGLGGASITRYRPQDAQPFSLGFDWNRPGEPERGGGAGQGFLRLRRIDDRLYAPDADPPYLGLGLATGIEGYVFASDARGRFARARMPGHLPPRRATATEAGAFVLPGALHGFDVIRFRGRLYASASAAIPPNGSAKSSPGALLTPGATEGPWQVAFTYPGAPREASVRLGYMTRFRDRLYVAISPLHGLDHHDFLIVSPPRETGVLSPSDARPVRISASGGSHTLRWYTDRGTLFWISLDGSGGHLWASRDGERFRELHLPEGAGAPSDLLRVGERLLILTERGLFTLKGDVVDPYVPAPEAGAPFRVDDGYCAAPLVAFGNHLYAGDQTRGGLWKLVAD